MPALLPVIRLPPAFELNLSRAADRSWHPAKGLKTDFSGPPGEPALVRHDSVSWCVFKNPIALLVGGIAAVVLELADPRIRTAIWRQSSFLLDPIGRLQRTGLAAMVTVYGARSIAEPMIARVVRMHSRISGTTPSGIAFSASDPALLTWVHATATYCFAHAYSRYVKSLSGAELDSLCEDALPVSRLYGATAAPASYRAMEDLMSASIGQLEASEAIFDFLDIMRRAPALPSTLRWLQPIAVRAAVTMIPPPLRRHLGLGSDLGLRIRDGMALTLAGALTDRLVLPTSPASQACVRLGLPPTYLHRPLAGR